jgi:lipoprotein NlpI
LRYWWLGTAALVCAAGVITSNASGYSKAAVAACQTASDDGDFRRTIAECGNLIKEPNVPAAEKAKALVNRCRAYYYKGEDALAIEDCTAAVAIEPGHALAFQYRGRAYGGRFQYDEAIRDFDRAIAIEPANPDVYVMRGFAYYNRGDNDAAIGDYERALKNNGDKGWVYYRRGTAFLARGEVQRGMDDYARSIPLTAKETPRFAAHASFYLGKYAEAASYFDEVSESDPYDAFFHYLSRRHAGRDDAATVFEAVESQLQSWTSQLVRYFRGESSKADLLKAAADPDPKADTWQRCEAEFYIGEVELADGNKAEARQRFETAVRICPKDFIELMAARAELARL